MQVSGRLSELKTTIDAGLSHRGNLLETMGDHFDQWNLLVCPFLLLIFSENLMACLHSLLYL